VAAASGTWGDDGDGVSCDTTELRGCVSAACVGHVRSEAELMAELGGQQ
jgi:hypothetical protein